MTQVLYAQRSMVQSYQRCRRLRWLENYEGAAGVGLTPKRRSIHLVIGSAVHSGMEVLLREGQQAVDDLSSQVPDRGVDEVIADLFASAFARQIEDRAVLAALADLSKEMGDQGVELDPEEMAAMQAVRQADESAAPVVDMGGLTAGMSSNSRQEDSPIVIDFGDLVPAAGEDVAKPVAVMAAPAPVQTPDQYLKEELAALCEGMVRAWSRRRWKSLLENFEVLEVEREGEWKLGEVEFPLQVLGFDSHSWWERDDRTEPQCSTCGVYRNEEVASKTCAGAIGKSAEIHFLSRHDALLLERSTNYLYLQSFKTTGTWDRRKEMDAQVDMQGLSEAVDVEKRFGEAWELLKAINQTVELNKDNWCGTLGLAATQPMWKKVLELVSERTAIWLNDLPDPPQILGVRYEYLLKGSRRKDRKDAMNPDKYVQESILVRAYKQEGITSDDRRWAWTYDWNDETGKGRRLDYRSWQKAVVWKTMPIADWIDLLDQGKVQEGALTEQGEPMDALAGQFVPVVTVYRSRDSFYDLMETMEAQEVQIAKDVAAVREAEKSGGYSARRSELNKRFGRTLTACSYPGKCGHWECCHGSPEIQVNPEASGLFTVRTPNHPAENNSNFSLAQLTEKE